MASTEPTSTPAPCDPGLPEGDASPAVGASPTAEEVARTMPEEATPAGMKAVLKEQFGELKRDWDAKGAAGQDELMVAGAEATEEANRDCIEEKMAAAAAAADVGDVAALATESGEGMLAALRANGSAEAEAREGDTPPPAPKPPPPVADEPAPAADPAPAEDKEEAPPASDKWPTEQWRAEADADGEDYHDKFKRETEKMGIVWQPVPNSQLVAVDDDGKYIRPAPAGYAEPPSSEPEDVGAPPVTPPSKKQRVDDEAREQTEDEKRTQDDVNKGWKEEQEFRERLAGGKPSKPASPTPA